MLVKDVMNKKLQTITSDATVLEAAKIMKGYDIGSLPVVDQDRPMGFITDRDIVIRCLAESMNPMQEPVSSCMTRQVVTVSADDSLDEAAKKMCENKVRRILVVENNNRPVGILNLNHIGTKADDPSLVQHTIDEFYKTA